MQSDGNVLNCLYPPMIDSRKYRQKFEEFYKDICDGKLDATMRYTSIPYYIDGEQAEFMPSLTDAARFYVAVQYILTANRDSEKKNKFDVIKSYEEFFNRDIKNDIKEFINDIIGKRESGLFKDIKIDVIKGSLYKIKKYFLENSKVKDIRGGSVLLDYINIDGTKELVGQQLIDECIVYCGGGNVFIIAPEGCGSSIAVGLETMYKEITLTSMNAVEYITCTLNQFAVDFKTVSAELNDCLEERKKIKLYELNPDSNVTAIRYRGDEIKFDYKGLDKGKSICKLCAIRDSKYIIPDVEEDLHVCPSCLRKHNAGRNKARFFYEFEEYTKILMIHKQDIQNFSHIADDRGYIAVIYGDGNNMGNVVMNIKNIFEMAFFSRNIDKTTKEAVYQSIYEVMGEYARFEVIALGGDDIFIVVPASVSLEIIRRIVNKFDNAFNNQITMSAGICIAKKNTPIKNMKDIAQDSMKYAKKLAREGGRGTVDIVIMEGSSNIDLISKASIFPISVPDLERVLDVVKGMKMDENIKKSSLYNLKYAASIMTPEEFQLFYLYQESRSTGNYTAYASRIFNLSNRGGFAGLIQKDNTYYTPWEDIVTLWDYVGGDV